MPRRGVGNQPTCGPEKYGLEHICCTSYINEVLIDWTRDFGDWLDQVTERADRGDRHSQLMLELMTAELSVLQDLTSMPDVETPTLRRVVSLEGTPCGGWGIRTSQVLRSG
jgi:hypothetical protein